MAADANLVIIVVAFCAVALAALGLSALHPVSAAFLRSVAKPLSYAAIALGAILLFGSAILLVGLRPRRDETSEPIDPVEHFEPSPAIKAKRVEARKVHEETAERLKRAVTDPDPRKGWEELWKQLRADRDAVYGVGQ